LGASAGTVLEVSYIAVGLNGEDAAAPARAIAPAGIAAAAPRLRTPSARPRARLAPTSAGTSLPQLGTPTLAPGPVTLAPAPVTPTPPRLGAPILSPGM